MGLERGSASQGVLFNFVEAVSHDEALAGLELAM